MAAIETAFEASDLRCTALRRLIQLCGALLALGACSPGQPSLPANVVLISVDTLRADRLNAYGYREHVVSEHIDELAREGVLFEKHTTSSPWTTPAHASLLTSLHPSTHGVIESFGATLKGVREGATFNALHGSRVTLAEVLRDAGYATAAFTGGITLDAKIGFSQGFERYDDSMYKLDDQNVGEMFAWLAEHSSEPFFLFWHTFEVHEPYLNAELLPPKYGGLRKPFAQLAEKLGSGTHHSHNSRRLRKFLKHHSAFEPKVCESLYVGGIRSFDRWLGRLVAELRRLGVYDQTLIVLTSDHGEEFAEHAPYRFYGNHGDTAYEEIIHVPLILKLPDGHAAATRVGAVTSTIDVMPTIVDILDLEAPLDTMQGNSLRTTWERPEAAEARIAFTEAAAFGREVKSLRTPRHKLILVIGPDAVAANGRAHVPEQLAYRQLFDLEEDPGERDDLLARGDPEADALAARLEARLRGLVADRPGKTDEVELDPETIEKLESLGYLD